MKSILIATCAVALCLVSPASAQFTLQINGTVNSPSGSSSFLANDPVSLTIYVPTSTPTPHPTVANLYIYGTSNFSLAVGSNAPITFTQTFTTLAGYGFGSDFGIESGWTTPTAVGLKQLGLNLSISGANSFVDSYGLPLDGFSVSNFTKRSDGELYDATFAAPDFVNGYATFVVTSYSVTAVPEPSTYVLLVGGAVLCGWVYRRKWRGQQTT